MVDNQYLVFLFCFVILGHLNHANLTKFKPRLSIYTQKKNATWSWRINSGLMTPKSDIDFALKQPKQWLVSCLAKSQYLNQYWLLVGEGDREQTMSVIPTILCTELDNNIFIITTISSRAQRISSLAQRESHSMTTFLYRKFAANRKHCWCLTWCIFVIVRETIVSLRTFLNCIPCMKIVLLWYLFRRNLFPMVELTIIST